MCSKGLRDYLDSLGKQGMLLRGTNGVGPHFVRFSTTQIYLRGIFHCG